MRKCQPDGGVSSLGRSKLLECRPYTASTAPTCPSGLRAEGMGVFPISNDLIALLDSLSFLGPREG